MSIYNIVLSNAFVALLTAPLRRLRYLLTVEDDLIEEGVLPPQGFGGTLGCIRFLYRAGGGSLSVFYRGAFLEAVGCIGKYELQRIISIPIARRIPLRMQHAVLATTFVHTALVYFTVAPLQTALDTIAVNGVTDFVVEDVPAAAAPAPHGEAQAPNQKKRPAMKQPVVGPPQQAGDAASAAAGELPPPPTVRLRFTSSWDTAKYLAGHFPVLSMVSRLYLIDFGCRYVTSLANNKILGWLMSKAQRRYNGAEMTSFQRLVLYAGCPLIASLAMSVLTYPFATYPVAHFLRTRYYERRAEEEAQAAAEVAQDYPISARHNSFGAAPSSSGGGGGHAGDGHNATSSHPNNSNNNNSSGSGSMSFTLNRDESRRKNGEEERFWWEEVCCRAVHWDVRDYLWKSMYGTEGTAMALALASSTTTPLTSSPTTAAASMQCPVGAGGRSSSKRGIGQVYRGFGLVVVSTLLSSALAMALNRAVDFVLHHSH